MASSRPNSMNIPAEVLDDINNASQGKSSKVHKRSSSSSIDSGSMKNDANSVSQVPSTARTSTTTSDSDFETEHDDARHSQQQLQKNDLNAQENLSRQTKHFHKLFQSEITDEMPDLIDSYVCAYQGDILLQGKMYITDRYLCFHSRIISYVTKHVYRWDEIEYITKERVAFIFPTAIGIQLKHTGKKVIYASFLTRDQAFDKIASIWSGLTNDTTSYDDDETDGVDDGTLRAENNTRRKKKQESYELIDGPDQEDVLQIYIRQNHDKGSINSTSSKSSNEKQTTKKPTARHSNLEHKLSNGVNENIDKNNQNVRSSRYTKHDQKQKTEMKKRHTSLVNHRSQSTTTKARRSPSRDRTSSSRRLTSSQSNPSSSATPTNTSSTVNNTSNATGTKISNTSVSFLNRLLQIFLSIFQHIQTYSMKTTILILLFLTLLFFHSFYLIKLSYRIENRLQSLHHLWPSS